MQSSRCQRRKNRFLNHFWYTLITMFWRCLIATVLLASCQKAPTEKKTNTFRMSFPHDANTLDPRKNSDYVGSTIHFMLFEGLTRMTPLSTHEPGIAKSIDLSEDKKTYTFHLRESFWSDGHPVTANDFVYAWKTLLHPDFPSPNAHLFYPIKNAERVKKGLLPASVLGLRAIDAETLEVTLEVPTPYFLDLTSFCVFSPIPSHVVQENARWADRPGEDFVTNGPFALKNWAFSNDYQLVKNAHYWDKEQVTLDRIEIMILNNEQTALNLFKRGDLDFYGAYNSIPSDWVINQRKEGSLYSQPVGYTSFITFNLNHPALQNHNIRKALTLAVHRNSLIEGITQCNEEAATRPVPTLLSNDTKSFFRDGNDALAQELFAKGLNELGLEKLEGLTFSYGNSTNNRLIAQAI